MIERLRRALRPSLARRVVTTLMATFVLVAVVLVLVDYVTYRRQIATLNPLLDGAQALAIALPADEAGAVLVMRASERQYNLLRRRAQEKGSAPPLDDVLFELSAAGEGRVAYASAGLTGTTLAPLAAPTGIAEVAGRRYGIAQADAPGWRVRLLEPLLADVTVLQWLARNLVGSILIAFPFVLLPVWWAVRRGLAPLRTLVARVTGRREGDFSPLELDLRLAELQPLVDSFNRLYGQSRTALARERGLVQDAAHELRTPLAVIATQAHALVSTTPGPAQAHALGRLEQAIGRASHQVHQVLTLARLEGQAVRAVQALECVESVRQALIDTEPRTRGRGIELSLDAPERLEAMLDRVAFHSIVDNLVGNALAHADGATRVQVLLRGTDHEVLLRVADDGIGIADDERPQLFDRFHRGRRATAPGSGLGLAIVREAARQLGGDVQIVTGLGGRGVGFELRFPFRPPG